MGPVGPRASLLEKALGGVSPLREDAPTTPSLDGPVHLPVALEVLGFQRVAPPRVDTVVEAPPERWLTTVLFIDIVDSTRQAARLGDTRWLDIETAYEAGARHQVRRFRGRVLLAAGDGLVAVFPNAAAGIRCAAEINRSTPRLGLDVRAAVHTGECERRGQRLGGMVFHIGARLVARASGGEILVSHAAKDRAGELGLTFVARGIHRLRGVPGRWPVYALGPLRDG
jgi:class 3 adenylate cyclase